MLVRQRSDVDPELDVDTLLRGVVFDIGLSKVGYRDLAAQESIGSVSFNPPSTAVMQFPETEGNLSQAHKLMVQRHPKFVGGCLFEVDGLLRDWIVGLFFQRPAVVNEHAIEFFSTTSVNVLEGGLPQGASHFLGGVRRFARIFNKRSVSEEEEREID